MVPPWLPCCCLLIYLVQCSQAWPHLWPQLHHAVLFSCLLQEALIMKLNTAFLSFMSYSCCSEQRKQNLLQFLCYFPFFLYNFKLFSLFPPSLIWMENQHFLLVNARLWWTLCSTFQPFCWIWFWHKLVGQAVTCHSHDVFLVNGFFDILLPKGQSDTLLLPALFVTFQCLLLWSCQMQRGSNCPVEICSRL